MFQDKQNLARITELEEQLQAKTQANDELLAKVTDTKVIVENLQATIADQETGFTAELKLVIAEQEAELAKMGDAHNSEIAELRAGVKANVTTQVASKLSEVGQPAVDLADDKNTINHLTVIEQYHELQVSDPGAANDFYRANRKAIWTQSRKN